MKKQNDEIKEIKESILIKNNIEDILNELGIKISTKGYKLWPEAVIIAMENDYQNISNIYIDLAKKHRTTASKVERALRYSYEDIKDTVQKYFKLNYKVGNKIFLECLARKARVICETAENVEK